MPTPLEAEISSLMRDLGDPSLVAEDLVRRWNLNLLSPEEQVDCAQFMLAAGLYPALFKQIRHILKNDGIPPWGQFAEAIGRGKIKPRSKELKAILAGAQAQNAEDALLRSYHLDLWDRTFGERRAVVQAQKALEEAERKKELKDQLEFLRENRMLEKEAQVLDEMQNIFPDETEIKKERESFEVRLAREIISNVKGTTDPTSEYAWRANRLPKDQLTAKQMIVERARELAQANPTLAYDLAVGLHFMDFNSEAIDVLELIKLEDTEKARAADWLKLELMILARRFVTVLDEASRLEIKYAGDPESAFAIVYARSRALWGLGQSSMAIDLLRSLVRIRPNYKSAQSLLMDWTGGDI